VKRHKLYLALPLVLGLSLGTGLAPASSADRNSTKPPATITRADGLLSPLSLAAGRHGLFMTQNFAGLLNKVQSRGDPKALYGSGGPEVGSVSLYEDTVYFSEGGGGVDGQPNMQWIKSLGNRSQATPRKIADVAAYEATRNPDGWVTYGFREVRDKQCLDRIPAGMPAKYKGQVDSHPYATAATELSIYVADAGANAILKVDKRSRRVSTVAVLPAASFRVSAVLAAGMGLPDCVVGERYYLEPVPTDVELGRNGWLYVTSLPGGPEDGSLGALGRVFKVHSETGKVMQVASGFSGATNLAVSSREDIYVAEMFGNKISVVKTGHHKAQTFLETTTPGALEIHDNRLYATTHALPDFAGQAPPAGKLIKIQLR
jgi:hypothetical protein